MWDGSFKPGALNLSGFVVGGSWCTGTCVSVAEAPLFSQDQRRNMEESLSSSASFYALQTALSQMAQRLHTRGRDTDAGWHCVLPSRHSFWRMSAVPDRRGHDKTTKE